METKLAADALDLIGCGASKSRSRAFGAEDSIKTAVGGRLCEIGQEGGPRKENIKRAE